MSTKKNVTKTRVNVRKGVGKSPTKKPQEKISIQAPCVVPLLLYRRIAITFVFVVTSVLVAVLYLSTVQAVISVKSTQESTTAELIASVRETPKNETEVRGTVMVSTIGKTQTFTSSTDEVNTKAIDDIAGGMITITNNLTFAQPLVARTRFLSESGILFRLKESMVVPASGSVIAEVYADKPGATGNIDPTRFTIPGLSPARQIAVFATSDQVFTGGVRYVSVVSQEMIDRAVDEMNATILSEAQTALVQEVTDEYSGSSYSSEIIQRDVSVTAQTEAESFDVTLIVKVVGVFFDRDSLSQLVTRKLYEGLGQGAEFANIDPSQMKVEIDRYNEEDKEANVHAEFSAFVITSQTNKALDVGRFVGMSEDEVRDLLVKEGIATKVDVKFFPFWVKKIPRLEDHIYIEIH